VNREVLKSKLRLLLSEAIAASSGDDMHRCINGDVVSMSSPECVIDIAYRIEDATADRNSSAKRTDTRTHYNGILNILRRKLRKSKKMQGMT
jgi:hypothetical protein